CVRRMAGIYGLDAW
nr:immunoglobulin heavy chain junction region [Macaca mulatta]